MPELPKPGTIKRRLFDDLRANPTLSADELAKRHGLNGHDLVKNLEQLRQQGFIDVTMKDEHVTKVRVRAGAANMALLERPSAAIWVDQSETAAKLAGAISKLPWLNDDWRQWDPELVRQASGLKGYQVGAALSQLREQGRLQQLGGGGRGKRIEGVRWRGERRPEQPVAHAPAESTNGTVAKPSDPAQAALASPPTPELDKYIAARELAAAAPTDNPFITISFEPIPIAEEAITLKRRLEGSSP